MSSPFLLLYSSLFIPSVQAWVDCYANKCANFNNTYIPCDGETKKCDKGYSWRPEAECRDFRDWESKFDDEVTCYLFDVCVHDNVTGIPVCVEGDFENPEDNEGWGYRCYDTKCWYMTEYIDCDTEFSTCFGGGEGDVYCERREYGDYIASNEYVFCPNWKNCTHDEATGQARCVGHNDEEQGGGGFKLSTIQIIGICTAAGSAVCGVCYSLGKCWLMSGDDEQVEYEPGAQLHVLREDDDKVDAAPPAASDANAPPSYATALTYAVPPSDPPPPDPGYNYYAPPPPPPAAGSTSTF